MKSTSCPIVSSGRFALLGVTIAMLSACAVYEPEPGPVDYGPGPVVYGPPVYAQPYPYYVAPPPVISFGFGGGGYYGHGGYYGRGRY